MRIITRAVHTTLIEKNKKKEIKRKTDRKRKKNIMFTRNIHD